jgi:hypothetical protein
MKNRTNRRPIAVWLLIVIWIAVQVLLIRSFAFLHVLYFVWGWVLILLTLTAGVRRYYTL